MFNMEVNYEEIGDLAVERAMKWLERSSAYPDDRVAELLSRVLKSPNGLEFTVDFVDRVIRPEDLKVAADSIARLSKEPNDFLPPYLRIPLLLGGRLAPIVPSISVPVARKMFRSLLGDLVLDAHGNNLTKAIAKLKSQGARLNMNLLGEAVLGEKEASKRLKDTMRLLERDDVEYVSIKVSAVIGPHNKWAYNNAVEYATNALLPLYERANSYETKKFINLDMEEYHDLHLTIDVFKRILSRPEFLNLSAGIVLQAYLPDALDAMKDLQAWASERVSRGGAPIKVRVVKGANLSMERVDAVIHGWELVTQPDKESTDANYIRVLDWALRPEHTKNVRIGVAGMNLFTVAFAYELAKKRGVFQTGGVEFEMLAGMASTQAKAIKEDVGSVLFYVPVVNPKEYDVAIAYLVRRLEENASSANFMSSLFELNSNETVLNREKQRFHKALSKVFKIPTTARRQQNRLTETKEELTELMTDENGQWTFNNTPDSDPSLLANVKWADGITSRMKDSKLGISEIEACRVEDSQVLSDIVSKVAKAGEKWAGRSVEERSDILHKLGVALSLNRGKLIEVAGCEAGKTVEQADVEVSEAVDFAHYYAEQAKELDKLDGAVFVPSKVVAVITPWNFPIAIPLGGIVAALASGSGVIFKPAPQSSRVGAVLAEILWEAGIDRDLVQLIDISEGDLGRELIENPLVDRVVLTGGIETARLFKTWRPDLGLLAETSGKDSIIVTPQADIDLAVKDVVYSAFGHAGQKCSACSTVILVGSVGTSKRFHDQLLDAVRSHKVGYPWDSDTQMGPLVSKASGKLLHALTSVENGQHWALVPHQLDDSGKLWSPGVRAGVVEGSQYHLTEYFGPILGVMRVDTLEEAVKLQNATQFGLTAGLHSLDSQEINYWLENVQAGNIYINRGITGAIVQRQPFGGWKRSCVGNGTKAGGPSYLFALGSFERDYNTLLDEKTNKLISSYDGEGKYASSSVIASAMAIAEELTEGTKYAKALISSSDSYARKEFFIGHDPSNLQIERNILRYLPMDVLIRLSKGQAQWQLLAVAATALNLGAKISVSVEDNLEVSIRKFLISHGVEVMQHSEEDFYKWLTSWSSKAGFDARIRLIGGDIETLCKEIPNENITDVAIWHGEVTFNGRIESLPFVHEQAVSITNHRFGNPTPLSSQINL